MNTIFTFYCGALIGDLQPSCKQFCLMMRPEQLVASAYSNSRSKGTITPNASCVANLSILDYVKPPIGYLRTIIQLLGIKYYRAWETFLNIDDLLIEAIKNSFRNESSATPPPRLAGEKTLNTSSPPKVCSEFVPL